MNLKTCYVLLILLLLGSMPGSALALDATAIVDAIQKQYDTTNTFQARFIQKSYLKILDQSQRAEGSVSIEKPGKMKWDYKAPDRQILVSNDQGLWLYLPEEKQVTKMKVQSIYSSNTPALFLAGLRSVVSVSPCAFAFCSRLGGDFRFRLRLRFGVA